MGQGNISIRVSFTITDQEFGSRMSKGNCGHTRQKADSSLPVWPDKGSWCGWIYYKYFKSMVIYWGRSDVGTGSESYEKGQALLSSWFVYTCWAFLDYKLSPKIYSPTSFCGSLGMSTLFHWSSRLWTYGIGEWMGGNLVYARPFSTFLLTVESVVFNVDLRTWEGDVWLAFLHV